MRTLSACICSWALATLTMAASAQSGPSLWDLGGSVLSLSAHGARREFRYQTVRPGLQEVGVEPGTLWFEGTRTGDQYSGTAYVFSKACGALAYPVTGSVSTDEQTIAISGNAPNIGGEDCSIVGYHPTSDALHFIQSTAISGVTGDTKTYGEDGRLFSSGNDYYFLLSRTMRSEGNQDASAYVGQVRVRHTFPGGGYEILTKDYSVTCKTEGEAPSVDWYKAGDHDVPNIVSIKEAAKRPKENMKESYNLYWAACFDEFRKFK